MNLDKNILLANLEIAQKRFDVATIRYNACLNQKIKIHAKNVMNIAYQQLVSASDALSDFNDKHEAEAA